MKFSSFYHFFFLFIFTYTPYAVANPNKWAWYDNGIITTNPIAFNFYAYAGSGNRIITSSTSHQLQLTRIENGGNPHAQVLFTSSSSCRIGSTVVPAQNIKILVNGVAYGAEETGTDVFTNAFKSTASAGGATTTIQLTLPASSPPVSGMITDCDQLTLTYK
jgi:hypothetical protein